MSEAANIKQIALALGISAALVAGWVGKGLLNPQTGQINTPTNAPTTNAPNGQKWYDDGEDWSGNAPQQNAPVIQKGMQPKAPIQDKKFIADD